MSGGQVGQVSSCSVDEFQVGKQSVHDVVLMIITASPKRILQ